MHWVLDVSFREDESLVRTCNAPENLATIPHAALPSATGPAVKTFNQGHAQAGCMG